MLKHCFGYMNLNDENYMHQIFANRCVCCDRNIKLYYLCYDIELSLTFSITFPLRWRHNGCDCVSNRQPHNCWLNRLFRCRSKKTSKLRVTGLCAGNSPGPVNFPHKWPVTRKMYPFDDVIMYMLTYSHVCLSLAKWYDTTEIMCVTNFITYIVVINTYLK